MLENKLVNVHIEKTAGRSLRQLFLEVYGADRVMTYDPVYDSVVRASQRLIKTEKGGQEKAQSLAENPLAFPFIKIGYLVAKAVERSRHISPESLPDDFDVLTGHFAGGRFNEVLPTQTNQYTAVIRNPLDRMRSHYDHWYRTRGLARFRAMPEFDKSLSFESFAMLPELRNYQSAAIEIDPADYYLLGDAARLPEYLEELGLSNQVAEIPHKNKGSMGRVALSTEFVRDFEAVHARDYELYESVQAVWV